MTTNFERFPQRTELTEKLSDPEYRAAFVQEEIRRGLPFQIRAIREARGMNQQQLGDATGIPQANISRIENTRNTFLSFQTLLKLAEAFDVALVVKFAPFSELEEFATRPAKEMVPPNYDTDAAMRSEWEKAFAAANSVVEMNEFLFRSDPMNQGLNESELLRRGPRKAQEGLDGSTKDHSGRRPFLLPGGAFKSHQQGR